MKNKLIILAVLILLTGCNNKITCKTEGSTEELKTEQTYKISTKNNSITKVEVKKTYSFKTQNKFENFENLMKKTVETKDENIKSSYKKKNKEYTLTEVYNIENMTDERLEELNIKRSKKEYIDILKSQGLTCK